MAWNRVVDSCRYPPIFQPSLQPIAPRSADHVQVVDVLVAQTLGRRNHRRASEQFCIADGMRAALLIPLRKMRQFGAQHHSLDFMQAAVEADNLMEVTSLRTMISNHAHFARKLRIIGRDETIVLRVPDDPAAVLDSLLSVYEEGQIAVLPFACKSSFAYAQKALGKVREESQRERLCITAARGAWNPSRQNDDAPPSESEDEAMRLAFAG